MPLKLFCGIDKEEKFPNYFYANLPKYDKYND